MRAVSRLIPGAALVLAGVAVVGITPPVGYRMSGYFNERLSTGIKDPLNAKAIVFRQGETQAAIVVCDLIGMTAEVTDKARKVLITPDDGSEVQEYPVSKRSRLLVGDGDHVEVGQKLIVGTEDPHDVLRILGVRTAQEHLVQEVQQVYRSQGVSIHDKHIEVIVRQMLKRVTILESGDAEMLPGELAERTAFEAENRRVVSEGGTPASGRPELMGITKASLATDSWLSAASFQETTRVLTDAAIHAKSDPLLGLKENVIIGKLIPAGTGLPRYRDIRVEPTEEAKAAVYSMPIYDDIDFSSTFGSGSGQAVPLEQYDFDTFGR
jgi:DNA-directed RNA polymerase subunit beta'